MDKKEETRNLTFFKDSVADPDPVIFYPQDPDPR
jgi:hypothetical protein